MKEVATSSSVSPSAAPPEGANVETFVTTTYGVVEADHVSPPSPAELVMVPEYTTPAIAFVASKPNVDSYSAVTIALSVTSVKGADHPMNTQPKFASTSGATAE